MCIRDSDYADPNQGSGAVKITPAHDFNDYDVGLRHDLEKINILESNGRLNKNCPQKYHGLDRFEARKLIIEDLKSINALEKEEKIKKHFFFQNHGQKLIIYGLEIFVHGASLDRFGGVIKFLFGMEVMERFFQQKIKMMLKSKLINFIKRKILQLIKIAMF